MNSKTQTTATKEETRPALVPQLRFPGFRGAEGWPSKTFKDFAAINKGEQLSAAEKDDDAIYPHFNGGMSPSSYTRKNNTEANTIIISEGGNSCGFVQFITVPFWCGGHCYAVAPITTIITRCLYYALQAKQRQIMALRVGSGLPNIQKSILEKFVLALPRAIPEQQKVAGCLSSVDELIAAQARKLDALKTHKKGLMQQLFPREGETQPRLRFPEFQNAGEWKEDKLIDIATFRRGSFPQPYGLPEWYDEVGGMPFVQVFDVGDNFRLKDKTKNKISKLGAEKSVFIPKGTLIVTLQGSIGRVAITHYDAYIDRTLLIFETFLKPIEKVFFARLIQNLFDIEKEIAPGGIIKTITKEALSDFKVKLPSIEEQQCIADCLTSLDDLITAQTQALEALKTHKQGLMQQLFPSPEEVTV